MQDLQFPFVPHRISMTQLSRQQAHVTHHPSPTRRQTVIILHVRRFGTCAPPRPLLALDPPSHTVGSRLLPLFSSRYRRLRVQLTHRTPPPRQIPTLLARMLAGDRRALYMMTRRWIRGS